MADRSEQTPESGPARTAPAGLVAFFRFRIGANAAAAWARLCDPHRGPRLSGELHDLPAVLWLALVAIAVVQVAVIFDEGSVAWARGLPEWINGVFQFFTEIGRSHWILVPTGVAGLVLLFGDWSGIARALRAAWAEIGALVGYAFFSVGGAAIVTNILKQLIGRGRPVTFDQDGWLSFDAFTFDYANASFPSGHSTTAGAAIMVGALIFPRFRAPIVIVGLLVAGSRVVVGAHFPSDTVAGLAVGISFAYLAARFLLHRRIGFHLDEGGHIRPRLGATRRAVRRGGAGAVLVAPFRALAGLGVRPSRG